MNFEGNQTFSSQSTIIACSLIFKFLLKKIKVISVNFLKDKFITSDLRLLPFLGYFFLFRCAFLPYIIVPVPGKLTLPLSLLEKEVLCGETEAC